MSLYDSIPQAIIKGEKILFSVASMLILGYSNNNSKAFAFFDQIAFIGNVFLSFQHQDISKILS